MKTSFFALAVALLCSPLTVTAQRKAETATPGQRLSTARVYREMTDSEGVRRPTLVVDARIPGPARLRIDLDSPLLLQWIQNDRGEVVQASNPYYAARILSLPPGGDLDPAERRRLLKGVFYFTISDLTPALVISRTFSAPLPKGGRKPIAPLRWDAFNPKGTWGYGIEEALRHRLNTFLLGSSPARDMRDFCPRYARIDRAHRIHFWQALLVEISERESSFVPFCASDEGRYNPGAKGVISSGLVQVSLASIRNACYQERGCDGIRGQEDLFDPTRNLHCGIAVMSCLVGRASCLSCQTGDKRWDGVAAYWSTLREPHQVPCSTCPSGKVRVGFKPEIRAALRGSAPYCF